MLLLLQFALLLVAHGGADAALAPGARLGRAGRRVDGVRAARLGGKKQAGPSEEARALYRELGLAEDADYDEINAVYEELEAKYKGDVKRIIKLKVARDKILEDRLRQRMQGTLQANDDVRVASDNFSDEKKPLIKLPRFLERITMFPTKDLMLKNAAVFAFVAFLPVLDKSWASTSLGLGFGVAMYLLYNRDEARRGGRRRTRR